MRKISFLLLLGYFFVFSAVSSAGLSFTLNSEIFPDGLDSTVWANMFSPIAFKVAGNYYPGAFLFRDLETDSISFAPSDYPVITGGNVSKLCGIQLRGFYYSEGRGERLWPLDTGTYETYFAGDPDLEFDPESAVYTNCFSLYNPSDYEENALYSYVHHTYSGVDYALSAGVQYTGTFVTGGTNEPIADSSLSLSLMRLEFPEYPGMQFPVGLMYDHSVGGIGFVGCRPKETGDPGDIMDVISAFNEGVQDVIAPNPAYDEQYNPDVDLLVGTGALSGKLECKVGALFQGADFSWLIRILGIVGIVRQGASLDKDSRSQLFSTLNVNNATLINAARQRATELCRDKWNTSRDGIECVDRTFPDVRITTANASNYEGKTLIVSGVNVVISEEYLARSSNRGPLDVFIDKGNLVLEQSSFTYGLHSFDVQGNPSVFSGVSSGTFLKGTFIVNGLLWGSGYSGVKVPHKLFIHGKFTSLNSIEDAIDDLTMTRVNQVNNLGIRYNGAELSGSQVSLQEIFTWQCERGHKGSSSRKGLDGTPCNSVDDPSFYSSSLVVINQNYPSKLIQ